MAAKIITFVLIAGINTAVAVLLFFFLLLGLNGFSERDAKWSIWLFLIGAALVTILAAVAGIFTTKFFSVKKGVNVIWAALISILIFSFLGAGINFLITFVGFFLAEAVRQSYKP